MKSNGTDSQASLRTSGNHRLNVMFGHSTALPWSKTWSKTAAGFCWVVRFSLFSTPSACLDASPWVWLDSITENHFFSLSCLLYPHVRATPNYTENPYFDRAWPQKLYLSPTSPLIPELDFPAGFSIENTPLVLFRRVDLLFNQDDLQTLYQNTYRTEAEEEDPSAINGTTKSLFSEESTWSLSPSEYMPMFLASPPEANFGTLVVSTAGHWTTTLMSAFRDEEAGDAAGYGIEGVKAFFKLAMRSWAGQVQDAIDEYRRHGGTRPKQVVVRAYLPGHEDCHDHRAPWTEIAPYNWRWYNWPWIQDFNAIFQVGICQLSAIACTNLCFCNTQMLR